MTVEEFLKENRSLIYCIINNYNNVCNMSADDVFQELSVKLYKTYKGLELEEYLRLSKTIVKNTCISSWRINKKIIHVPLTEAIGHSLVSNGYEDKISDENFEYILSKLDSDLRRDIIRRKLKDDESFQDIAKSIGMKYETVRSHYYDSIKKLKNIVKR